MPPKTHTFRGLRYHLVLNDTIEGWAEVPGRDPRTLYVDARLKGTRSHLDCAIHEAMHAIDKDLKEAVVEYRATALAKFLWAIGYRLKE